MYGPTWSYALMRAVYLSTNCAEVTTPEASASCIWGIVASVTSKAEPATCCCDRCSVCALRLPAIVASAKVPSRLILNELYLMNIEPPLSALMSLSPIVCGAVKRGSTHLTVHNFGDHAAFGVDSAAVTSAARVL